MGKERRLHPRTVVRLAAEIRDRRQADWGGVLIYDLSAGGTAIHSARELPLQSEVMLRFRLPDGGGPQKDPIEVLCLVVRSGRPAQPDPRRPLLFGLHFLDLHGESFDRVRTFVWDLAHRERNPED